MPTVLRNSRSNKALPGPKFVHTRAIRRNPQFFVPWAHQTFSNRIAYPRRQRFFVPTNVSPPPLPPASPPAPQPTEEKFDQPAQNSHPVLRNPIESFAAETLTGPCFDGQQGASVSLCPRAPPRHRYVQTWR